MKEKINKNQNALSPVLRPKPDCIPHPMRQRALFYFAVIMFLCLAACSFAFAELDRADAYLFPGDRTEKLTVADTPEMVKSSEALASSWFVNQVLENGLFVYLYDPAIGRYPAGQSVLRQLMATRTLGIMASTDSSLLKLHEKNLNVVLGLWYREDETGLGFMLENEISELGSNAMALRALVASPFFDRHAKKAKKLAEGICACQRNDGSFTPFFIFPDFPFDGAYIMAFYSGEATLALLEYYEKTGEKQYLDAAKSAQACYLSLYVPPVLPNYYPACVPWQTLALSKLYSITKDERYSTAAFTLNEKLLEIQETKGNPGRFTNLDMERYGGTHSSSDGVYTESLAYALELAVKKKDAAREKVFRRALFLAVRNLKSLQYTKEPLRLMHGARSVVGALMVRDNDGVIRIDCVQHTLDAFRKIREVW